MWKEGSIKVVDKIYHYEAKIYDEPSKFGINGGRISKLNVRLNGKEIINYDRGWDKEPSIEDEKAVLYIILNDYN